jgi:hypothetical protein
MTRIGKGQASSRPHQCAAQEAAADRARYGFWYESGAEFARVWASFARPGSRPGMAAALKTQDKALLREIDELLGERQW